MEQHPRVGIEYKTIQKHDLPFRLQELYHDCGQYSAMASSVTNGGPPMCKNCNKVVPWFFYKCVKCESYFVRDFRHPKFCQSYPTCWEHTLELPWEYCEQHDFPPRPAHVGAAEWMNDWYRPFVEPLGLNPKNFTEEELAGVFDF